MNRDPHLLLTWGVPECCAARYKDMGVSRLFDWQVKCLMAGDGECLRGHNLVYRYSVVFMRLPLRGLLTWMCHEVVRYPGAEYCSVSSAPTSGGKTLVAELMILRRLALLGGLTLFVVPFVSLAEEKTNYLQAVWRDMHVGVRAMHGEDGG